MWGELGDHEPEVVVGVVVLAQAERMGADHVVACPLASFGIAGDESIDGEGRSIFQTHRADQAELQGWFGVWSIFETQERDTFPRLLTRICAGFYTWVGVFRIIRLTHPANLFFLPAPNEILFLSQKIRARHLSAGGSVGRHRESGVGSGGDPTGDLRGSTEPRLVQKRE